MHNKILLLLQLDHDRFSLSVTADLTTQKKEHKDSILYSPSGTKLLLMAGCVSGVMNWDSIVSSENFKKELTMTLWLHKDSCEALVFFNTLKFSFVETKISNSIGKSNRHMKSMPVLKVPIGGKIWRPFSWSFFFKVHVFCITLKMCKNVCIRISMQATFWLCKYGRQLFSPWQRADCSWDCKAWSQSQLF